MLDKWMGVSYNDIAFQRMESHSECSSVWYERLVRDQEAAGSSPVIPIYLEPVGRYAQRGFSCVEGGKVIVDGSYKFPNFPLCLVQLLILKSIICDDFPFLTDDRK